MTKAEEIISRMLVMKDDEQQRILSRFFKTGEGEYGEGDKFLGIRVPKVRAIVREYRLCVSFDEIEMMLGSEWHEVRLCALLLLVEEMKAALPHKVRGNVSHAVGGVAEMNASLAKRRSMIAEFYLLHDKQANNWDLVDLSCGYILGAWLLYPLEDGELPSRRILDALAKSDNLWEQRIAIVSTSMLIRNNQYDDTIRIAESLLYHTHDLIHKAVGWMLREVGKRDIRMLRCFLRKYHRVMPRTMLRYAIEKLDVEERKTWMSRNI